jgi:hypothetical protein
VSLKGTGCESVNWRKVEQEKIQCWGVVSTAMKPGVTRQEWWFFSAEEDIWAQEGLGNRGVEKTA